MRKSSVLIAIDRSIGPIGNLDKSGCQQSGRNLRIHLTEGRAMAKAAPINWEEMAYERPTAAEEVKLPKDVAIGRLRQSIEYWNNRDLRIEKKTAKKIKDEDGNEITAKDESGKTIYITTKVKPSPCWRKEKDGKYSIGIMYGKTPISLEKLTKQKSNTVKVVADRVVFTIEKLIEQVEKDTFAEELEAARQEAIRRLKGSSA